jgi:predicted DNA-binding protein
MSKVTLCIELPSELYERLKKMAQSMSTIPEKLVATLVEEYLAPLDLQEEEAVLERLKSLGYV